MSTNFELNFEELHEIDVTPTGSARTYARLGAGISSAVPSNNDSVDQSTYLNGDGYASSEVIGAQKTIAFSGHRLTGDTAQDFIDSTQEELGDGRKSSYKFTDSIGNQVSGECTIANIVIGGGDAAAKKEIAFEVHLNGKPERTPKSISSALTATVAAGSAIGTTKFTATAGTGNTLRYKLSSVSSGTIYSNQYLAGSIAYTSASDIIATAGQYLQMYEINSYGRVVKYLQQVLAAGDIKSA
jgi:hypothetical protein